ncbi:MAG: RecX family transcriptional regulator [Leptolinea sp.]
MPLITALTSQKRNPNRLNVFLDGDFAFGVERIVAAWLSVGDEVDSEKIQAILQKDELEKAYNRALRFLGVRVRSVHEVSVRLEEAGYSPDAIEKTVQRLQSAGLLSDTEFAQTWVENRCTFRPRAKRALVLELRQKGIIDNEIQSAVRNLDETKLAQQAAELVISRFEKLPFDEFRKKLFGYLSRRGFSYGDAIEAIQITWQQAQDSAETLH